MSDVRYLWLQDQVAAGNMALHEVHDLVNPTDLVTKHLGQEAVTQHLESLDMWVESGRAQSAPVLNLLGDDSEPRCDVHFSAVRVHHKPGRELFTPRRVAGAPPAKGLTRAGSLKASSSTLVRNSGE